MELLLILLVLAWAVFTMTGHFTGRFKKSSSCCDGCKNCPEGKTCFEKEKLTQKEGDIA